MVSNFKNLFVGTTPHPATVTTRIIPFLVGNPYKPSFVTVTGWEGRPNPFIVYYTVHICLIFQFIL